MLLQNPIVKREAEKAMLIQFDVEVDEMLVDLEEWMPISQIKSMTSQYLEVSDWIAEQKDLQNKAAAKSEPDEEAVEISEPIQGAKFTLKVVGNEVRAVLQTGEVIATAKRVTATFERGFGSYYDTHRQAKGDSIVYDDEFTFSGKVDEVIERVNSQMPEEYKATGFKYSPIRDGDDYERHNFLFCVAKGFVCFGNTKASVRKAAEKRSQDEVVYEYQ